MQTRITNPLSLNQNLHKDQPQIDQSVNTKVFLKGVIYCTAVVLDAIMLYRCSHFSAQSINMFYQYQPNLNTYQLFYHQKNSSLYMYTYIYIYFFKLFFNNLINFVLYRQKSKHSFMHVRIF